MTPEEEELLRQQAAANNSMTQPYDLIGQQGQQETGMDTDPLLTAGLGGAAAFQGMFPFAGEAAANSRGTTLPQLMGTGNSQFTGSNAGRLTQGTQIVPQTQVATINQPPAVQSSGSLANKTTTAKPGTANYGVNRTSPYTMGPFKSLLGTLTKGLVGSLAVTPNTAGAPTISGVFNSRVAAGEDPAEVRASLGLDADYGNAQDFGYAVPDATLDTTTSVTTTPVMEAPQNALLDLAERENALGPKLTDIFSGRAEALSAPTENPIDATDPGPVAAPGSPQAIFEEAKKLGLGDRNIAGFEKSAARMGTTFDPVYGFSRDPFLQAQADKEYLANRPGYGYGGAANDQYQGADFDTISQGVFDTPMTGMRPINAETGEPLSQGVIDAAARAGLELPMGSVPLPQSPVNSVPMGRDETRARLGGMTLNQYLDAPDGAVSGLRTDPQGRMIPGGFETRADAYRSYEDESAAREGRLAARMQQPGESITERDTRIAGERTTGSSADGGPRTYGGYTTAQLRGMVGGGDALRAAQMRAEAGLNPITGNRESTEEQNQLQTEVLKARLDKLKEQEPDKLSKAESYADRLQLQGDARTAFIFSQMGTAMDDVFGLEGTGAGGGGGSFTEAQESSISKVMGANPGSSREQIIAEMKKQGKL